jgi:hypothetical protein
MNSYFLSYRRGGSSFRHPSTFFQKKLGHKGKREQKQKLYNYEGVKIMKENKVWQMKCRLTETEK